LGHVDYTGKTLEGRYQVVRVLGQGGMGAVYEGRHAIVGKRVAIKMLHAEFAENEEVLKRFYREAQAAAAIGHKNIIDIMDVGVSPDGEPFLVMEYLEGEDLDSMLERTGPLSLEATCGILEPALLALFAAHAKGIVHRDLKPANIFLVRNEGAAPTVKLIDFGISKFSGGTVPGTKLTQTGSLLGTPAYMSPEQARGDAAVDHRTDIYSMGVIVYQMLAGVMPFKGDNYNTLLLNVLTTSPCPLREVNPEIPPEADALVLKQLSKDPLERSQTALEMLEALKGLAAYKERESGMSLLGTRIESGVASGDIGKEKTGGTGKSSASRVLSQMAKGTPAAWAGTGAKKGPPKGLVIGIAAAAIAVVAAVAFVLVRGGSTQEVAVTPAVAPAAVSAAEQAPAEAAGVLITVEGAPQGATIIFDGAPVPMNPFRVKKATTLAPLKVEAPGFEPFARSIAPEKDLVVEVVMKPIAEAAAATTAAAEGAEKPGSGHGGKKKKGAEAAAAEPTGSTTTSTKPAPKDDISEGRRGALMTDKFE
jgi:tRNA A-37 threonylcarbamoyl transferase component Bud32